MSADAITARNEIFALINNAVAANLPGTKLYWQGVVANDQPAARDTWARVSMNHFTGNQASLAGVDGVRRWNRAGIITAQCFAPLASGSVQAATKLACVVRDALQGKKTPSGVWFRNPRINDIDEDRSWYNVNALIEFNYDELR